MSIFFNQKIYLKPLFAAGAYLLQGFRIEAP